jgi:hypothetical protein
LQHVAIHQAAGAEQRRQARSYTAGNTGIRQPLEDDLPGKVAVGIFFEGQLDVRQAIERDGTHHHHVRNAVHLEFERERDQALDFLRGVPGPLGGDFDLRRCEVGVGVHRHALERDDAANGDEGGQHQHQEALTKRGLDDLVDHMGVTMVRPA